MIINKLSIYILFFTLGVFNNIFCQQKGEKKIGKEYQSVNFYDVDNVECKLDYSKGRIKNIIVMIGDGMGLSQIFSAMVANRGRLNLDRIKVIGFSKTSSIDDFITDSAAGATAISTGKKTYNGAIAVDKNKNKLKTIVEILEDKGVSTGLVSTSTITHATPASFIAHRESRKMYEDIALDFLKVDVDVIIGGGMDHFNKRKDKRDLLKDFRDKNYRIIKDIKTLKSAGDDRKILALLGREHLPKASDRDYSLSDLLNKSIDILSKNDKGFFLMVEGSQIDWGGHANDIGYVVDEMLDFDKAIGSAMKFVSKNEDSILIVTADHETGGLVVKGGVPNKGLVKGVFTTGYHTPVMVPVFAFGKNAYKFGGIYENTEIFNKLMSIINL